MVAPDGGANSEPCGGSPDCKFPLFSLFNISLVRSLCLTSYVLIVARTQLRTYSHQPLMMRGA
jgi:hypothetical protein